MKKLFILIFVFTGYCKIFAQPVNYYIQADADDWQLFMSSKVIADLQSGGKVIFITLTAGDEGNGTATFNGSATPYYLARENGAVYSSKFAWDILQNTASNGTLPVIQTVNINNHLLKKYVYANTVNYFFRLPDGNSTGSGFTATANKSLKKLQTGNISSIIAIDGSTTYTSWNDLTNTIATIINNERGLNAQVWLNTTSLDSTNTNTILNNSGDYSDHYYSSKAAQDAVTNLIWVGINEYINNRSSALSANLTNSSFQNATAIFSVCDWALALNKYTSKFTTANKAFLPMDYYSVKRIPVAVPLPVTLINFSAQLQQSNVLLNWSTSSEFNSRQFVIERSEDGINFQKLGSLSAAGNSNVVKNYNYVDYMATDINYYRLISIDNDGYKKISDVIVIKNPGVQQDVFVINNPFIDKIGIRFAKTPKGTIAVSLRDISGKLIGVVTYSQLISSLLYEDKFAEWISSGIYILQVQAEGKFYNFKIIKQ